jgi:hypothetical protein
VYGWQFVKAIYTSRMRGWTGIHQRAGPDQPDQSRGRTGNAAILSLKLNADEIKVLEAPYVPHRVSGVS